jgi:hypothetical protein
MRLRARWQRNRVSIPKMCQPAQTLTYPLIHWTPGFVPGMNLPGLKADYWPPARAEPKTSGDIAHRPLLHMPKTVDRTLTFSLAGVFRVTGTQLVFLTASIFETTPFRLCGSQRSLVVWCLRTTGLHWMLLVFDSNWCNYTSKFKLTMVRKCYN